MLLVCSCSSDGGYRTEDYQCDQNSSDGGVCVAQQVQTSQSERIPSQAEDKLRHRTYVYSDSNTLVVLFQNVFCIYFEIPLKNLTLRGYSALESSSCACCLF